MEAFLRTTDLARLPEGRTELQGTDLYVSCSPAARTRPAGEAPLEAHRGYIDVQVVLQGRDTMGWAPLEVCTDVSEPYDVGRDIVFFRNSPQSWIQVEPGQIAVFFPEDAHAPLVGDGTAVHKLVVKVRVASS